MPRAPPSATLFPYTTLFRSVETGAGTGAVFVFNLVNLIWEVENDLQTPEGTLKLQNYPVDRMLKGQIMPLQEEDRKSTRLNSSHVEISYAVFCLKKKNNKNVGPKAFTTLAARSSIATTSIVNLPDNNSDTAYHLSAVANAANTRAVITECISAKR